MISDHKMPGMSETESLSHRLVRKICLHWREPEAVEKDLLHRLGPQM
jgi:hypothetical protein